MSLAAVLTLFVIVEPAWSTPMDAASELLPPSLERSAPPDFVALDPPADEHHRTPGAPRPLAHSPSGFFMDPVDGAPGSAAIYAFREAALENMFGDDGNDDEAIFTRVMDADTDVPMVINSHVERHIEFLLRRPGHVRTLLRRADIYFPMIEQILREEGAPDELKYLAMVESALKPTARSWAGAAGMWQFIPETGSRYGLTVNREVDWRLDPERATRAAARHLLDLHARFDDWHLALAGYNMNPARVERYAREFERRHGRKATYWDIYHRLPRETKGFVPMFIATALVFSDPEAYGFDLPRPGPGWSFDRIPVQGGTRLSDVAEIVGVRESAIEALNPALRRGRAPAGELVATLRIPSGTYRRYARQLDRLAPGRGDHIAEAVAFPERAFNPISPDGTSSTHYAARSMNRRPAAELLAQLEGNQSGRERARSRGRTWGGPSPASSEGLRDQYDEVSTADSQSRSDRPAAELVARLHNLDENNIPLRRRRLPQEPQTPDERPARELVAELRGVPVEELKAREAEEQEEDSEASRERPRSGREALPVQLVSDANDEEPEAPATHVVRRGEWLMQIAREYGVSHHQIMSWNDLRSETVHPGQELLIYGDPEAAPPGNEPRTFVYTVKRGDNLTQIARRHGCSVHDLRRWNSLSRDRIVPGQRLTIRRELAQEGVAG